MSSTAHSSLGVRTIDHITLVVADLEKSRWFYSDVLGMQEVERPSFGFPGLWFQAGKTQIHMNTDSPEAGPAGMPPFEGSMPSRGFHYAFEVDDCHAAAKQLEELGIIIVTGPRARPDGWIQLYIYDPDGHLVEICSSK